MTEKIDQELVVECVYEQHSQMEWETEKSLIQEKSDNTQLKADDEAMMPHKTYF